MAWLRLSKKHNPKYEAESERIRENKGKSEAKRPHKFKAAEWTHPNGHPRCLVCGDEERTGGECKGLEKEAYMGWLRIKAADQMVNAYLEAALFTDTDNSDPSGGNPLDQNYSIEDFSPDSLAKATADCEAFSRRAAEWIRQLPAGVSLTQLGHDFWLTRNGHGVGFWDRPEVYGEQVGDQLTEICKEFGEVYTTVGDDGVLYLEGGKDLSTPATPEKGAEGSYSSKVCRCGHAHDGDVCDDCPCTIFVEAEKNAEAANPFGTFGDPSKPCEGCGSAERFVSSVYVDGQPAQLCTQCCDKAKAEGHEVTNGAPREASKKTATLARVRFSPGVGGETFFDGKEWLYDLEADELIDTGSGQRVPAAQLPSEVLHEIDQSLSKKKQADSAGLPPQPGSDLPPGVSGVYDNGGATADRYTVYYDNGTFVGMSENPSHPQGFGQHGEGSAPAPEDAEEVAGKPIAFSALPPNCQKLVMQDLGSAIEKESAEDPEDEGPAPEDYTITPSGQLGSRYSVGQVEGKFLGEFDSWDEAVRAIRSKMEKEQFFPGVWNVSDHGNVEPVDLSEERRGSCEHCKGTGKVPSEFDPKMDTECETCHGTGDWDL
jgi:hypothetical protein